MRLELGVTDVVMGLYSSDEIILLPNDLVNQFSHNKYLVDHDNIIILSPK